MAKSTRRDTEGAQFVRYFGPVLSALRTLGGSGRPREVVEQVARDLKISEDAQTELLDSGSPRFPNQVHWARFYLAREGLLDSSKRGVWSLTDKGRSTQLSPSDARELFLRQVRLNREGRDGRQPTSIEEPGGQEETLQPEGHREVILDLLMKLPAAGFEHLCQRILREAGFVQVVVTGRSGDGGIDGYGTLQVNPLVSFKVLFQCKKYSTSVSSPAVRDFRGAMQGRADKGIILTTGTFTIDARREANRDGVPPIELVDGERLVDMLEEFELGLKPVTAFEVDTAFFEEFRDA